MFAKRLMLPKKEFGQEKTEFNMENGWFWEIIINQLISGVIYSKINIKSNVLSTWIKCNVTTLKSRF